MGWGILCDTLQVKHSNAKRVSDWSVIFQLYVPSIALYVNDPYVNSLYNFIKSQ